MNKGTFTVRAKLGTEKVKYLHEGEFAEAMNKLIKLSEEKNAPINHLILNRI